MNLFQFNLFSKKLNEHQRSIISNSSTFYNLISDKNKSKFENRVVKFINYHDFIGREGVVVTQKMKLLIAETAVKLTFGYKSYLFSVVDKIIIYPKDYFSQSSKKQHKGEVNPKYNAIVFSWKDFKEGIKIENDNLNLGLHEFTHAMHFSFLSEKTPSSNYFLNNFNHLLKFLQDKDAQNKLINAGYLRAYAFENQYEFLAVLVEHFFETPKTFKEKLPEIYYLIQRILKIDIEKL